MNIKAKLAAILTGLVISTGSAYAANCASPATIGAWAGLAGGNFNDAACDGDTTWHFVGMGGTVNLAAAGMSLTENIFGGIDVYNFLFDFTTLAGGAFGPNNSSFIDYTVTILNPLEFWTSFALDSTCPAPPNGCTVVKTVNGASLTSVAGANVGPSPVAGAPLVISVHETFTTNANGVLSGSTNTYTLNNRTITVPEPMSLALLGIGLAAAGFASRRRKS